jgi:peptidoglycan hydrolase-like protein with peptidoglycan-binding domain
VTPWLVLEFPMVVRVFAAILTVLMGTGWAFGQATSPLPAEQTKPAAKPAEKTKAKAKPKPAAKPRSAARSSGKPVVPRAGAPATNGLATDAKPEESTAKQSVKDSYAAIPLAERLSIQSDLIWTGDYNGLINGEFSDRLVAAVKAFQKRNKSKDTGVLNPQERAVLAASAKPLQDEVGWQLVEDRISGARLGLPGKLATETSRGQSGTHWSSAQGQLQIETFRIPNTRLEAVFEREKREPFDRRPSYNLLRPDFFVVSGIQGLKKFYVRAFVKDNEVRGISILYDQAMDGIMDPVVVAMSSAFVPFGYSTAGQDSARTRRKVEYATGLVVSASGHIVTDKNAIDGCQVITVPGLGHAERLAEDRSSDLALMRVHGARDLVPIGLLGPAARHEAVALVGVADPQTQGGGGTVSTVTTRTGSASALDAAPGFSGAAAIDRDGRLVGMAAIKTPVIAGPTQPPQASVVPLERMINFLEANYVAPQSARPGTDAAKTAVVRVICVRK